MNIFPIYMRSLSIITVLVPLIIAVGCASVDNNKNVVTEHIYIIRVVVQDTGGILSSIDGRHLSRNAATGLLGGTLRGILFEPFVWLMGVPPFVTMAMEGARGAACGSALGHVDNPAGQLQEMVGGADIKQFRQELESALQEAGSLAEVDTGNTFHPGSTDVLLEVREMTITLKDYMSEDEFVSDCQPYLTGNVKWRAIKTSDGRTLKEGKTQCSTNPSFQSFKEWFDDKPGTQDQINWLLQRMGRQVATDLAMDNKNRFPC